MSHTLSSPLHEGAVALPPRSLVAGLLAVLLLCPTISAQDLTATAAATAPPVPTSLDQVRRLVEDGDYAGAEALGRRLLADTTREQGRVSLAVADDLDLLVRILLRGASFDEGEPLRLAEEAVAIREQLHGPDHPQLATSLLNLGTLLYLSGEYERARTTLEKTLRIQEHALGPVDPALITTLNVLANIVSEMGELPAARVLYERALAIAEQDPSANRAALAKTLNNLAIVLSDLGDHRAAGPIYERAVHAWEDAVGPSHIGVAGALQNLAIHHWEMGHYAEARHLYERSLQITTARLGSEHPDVARLFTNIGNLLADMGNHAEAGPYYERALQIWEETLRPDHPDVGKALNNLAVHLTDLGDHRSALPLYERALKIYETSLGRDHARVANVLDNMAALFRETGDYARAREIYNRTLEIWTGSLGPDHPRVAIALLGLGTTCLRQGETVAARNYMERALQINENALGTDHPQVAACLIQLAHVRAARGEIKAAFDLALRGETIARENLLHTLPFLSEWEALRYAAVRQSALDLVLSLAMEHQDPEWRRKAWDLLIRSRALVLDEMAARRRVVSETNDPEIIELHRRFSAAGEELATLLILELEDESVTQYREDLAQARRKEDELGRALSARSVPFRDTQKQRRLGLLDVAASMPERTALVAFVRYGHHRSSVSDPVALPSYAAFMLMPDRPGPELVPLGTAAEIDEVIARWREEVVQAPRVLSPRRHDENAHWEVGTVLREAIWDPIAAHVRAAQPAPGVELMLVVPDGSLNLINLAALPAGERQYLLETEPLIHHLSAEREIVPAVVATPPGDGLLAIGGPDFDANPAATIAVATAGAPPFPAPVEAAAEAPASLFRGRHSAGDSFGKMHFEPLMAASLEIEEIGTLWRKAGDDEKTATAPDSSPNLVDRGLPDPEQRVLLLTGTGASEAAVKMNAPGRRVLHLATHGFFLDQEADPTPTTAAGLIHHPLLLSGLALAAANRRAEAAPDGDDGILTAQEISAMDLSGVEWVVLSACNTGLGAVHTGEGVGGLRRAFDVAGAETLIMSLWSVEDRAARRWMRELYRARLVDRLGTAQAVHQTSLRILQQRRERGRSTHPFYWAAFVAAGEWR